MYGPYFLTALANLAPTLSHDETIAALKSARAAIEQSSDRWSNALIISTAIVAAGVVLEIVAEAMEVRKDLREGKKIERFHVIAFLAAAVVALFVAIEGVAELKVASKETSLRENNSAEQLELQKSVSDANANANKATADAVAVAAREGGLESVVAQTSGRIDALKLTADADKKRADALMASLTAKQQEVAAMIEAAQKDEAVLRASADTIRDLRQQLHDLTVDRHIAIGRLAEKLKPFAKTPFVFEVSNDRDAINLCGEIGQALDLVGWDQHENKASDNSFEIGTHFEGKPAMRIEAARGVTVEVPVADEGKLGPAAEALAAALHAEDLKYVESGQIGSNVMTHKKMLPGVIHIIVGTRQ